MNKKHIRHCLLLTALCLPLLGACQGSSSSQASSEGASSLPETTTSATSTPTSSTPTSSTPTSSVPTSSTPAVDPEADYKVNAEQFASLTGYAHYANVSIDCYRSDTGFPSNKANDPHLHFQIENGIALGKDVNTSEIGEDSYFAFVEGATVFAKVGEESVTSSQYYGEANYQNVADYLADSYGYGLVPATKATSISVAAFASYSYDSSKHAYVTVILAGSFEYAQAIYFAHGEILRITSIYRETATQKVSAYSETDYSGFGTSVSMPSALQANFLLGAYKISSSAYAQGGLGGFEKAAWLYSVSVDKAITSDGTLTSHKKGVYESGLFMRLYNADKKGVICQSDSVGVAMVDFDQSADSATPEYAYVPTMEGQRFGNTFEKFYEPIPYASLSFDSAHHSYVGTLSSGESVTLSFLGQRLMEEKVEGSAAGVKVVADYTYSDYGKSYVGLSSKESDAMMLTRHRVDGFGIGMEGLKNLNLENFATRTAKIKSYGKATVSESSWESQEEITIAGDKVKVIGSGTASSFIAQAINSSTYAYIELKPDNVSVSGSGSVHSQSGGFITSLNENDVVAGILEVPASPTQLTCNSENHYVATIGDDSYDYAFDYGSFSEVIYSNPTIGSGVYNKHTYNFGGYKITLTSEQSAALKALGAAG